MSKGTGLDVSQFCVYSCRGDRAGSSTECLRWFQQQWAGFDFCHQRWDQQPADINHTAHDDHTITAVSELAHYTGEPADYLSRYPAPKHAQHATGYTHEEEREARRGL